MKTTALDQFQLLKDIEQRERQQARFAAKHPDLCAYDRVEQALRNLLTGKKLDFCILDGRKVVVSAGRKITNTLVKQIIEARKNLCAAPADPLFDQIKKELRVYDEELVSIETK